MNKAATPGRTLDVSVIIPVFNKADLTRVCLQALERELPKSLNCEVLVVDNDSSDDTASVLREFPWIRVLSNARNLGYAAANNQAAAAAGGDFLLLLNNDTQVQPGFLEPLVRAARRPGVGAVGGRLLFANRTIQHAGVVIQAARFGPYDFVPYHFLWSDPGKSKAAMEPKQYQVITGAALLTPRELYNEVGGLDEAYWNGNEDIDYCFKLAQRGLRIEYEPACEILHFESQSGTARFSRTAYNTDLLMQRWAGFPRVDHNHHYLQAGVVRRWVRLPNKLTCESRRTPKTTILVHGLDCADSSNLKAAFGAAIAPIEKIIWNVPCAAPDFEGIPVVTVAGNAVDALRGEMNLRGDRYLAVVDGNTLLEQGWLEELIEFVEWGTDVVAATTAPELSLGRHTVALTADARCTLLSLRQFPQHEVLGAFDSLDGALADYLLRALRYEFATRGVSTKVATLAPLARDSAFESAYGAPVGSFLRDDAAYVEKALGKKGAQEVAKASIIMLSWNALQYTQIAIDSIREHTRMPYEIIIIDNGSGAETIEWLRAQTNLTVIYNSTNRGFAKGCNQGIAAATGDYIVLLNNDVVVTDGWLENLVDALRRDPAAGISAPRSNEIAGDQKLIDSNYANLEEMHAMAGRRAREFRRAGYYTDRAIGFCLCIDRKVIQEVGGIDEDYGTGNFEDDDFCMRVRGAGYRIFVCDDVFIHHFGSVSFRENRIDYMETMHRNWSKFATKWGFSQAYPANGYEPRIAISRGFDRTKHYVPLPPAPTDEATSSGRRLALKGVVQNEGDWTVIGAVVRRFLSSFSALDDVAFAIACTGALGADQIGARVEKMVERLGLDPSSCADVLVSEESDLVAWSNSILAVMQFEISGSEGARLAGVPQLKSRGRSDLKRIFSEANAP